MLSFSPSFFYSRRSQLKTYTPPISHSIPLTPSRAAAEEARLVAVASAREAAAQRANAHSLLDGEYRVFCIVWTTNARSLLYGDSMYLFIVGGVAVFDSSIFLLCSC